MQLHELECPDCGTSTTWLFDASLLREREFEGMFFEVTEVAGKVVVKGQEEDKEYLTDFNMTKLSKQAVEIIQDTLDGGDARELVYLYCPKCQEPLA